MERIVNLHIEKLSEGLYLAKGENEHLCREAWAKNHIGDNMTLDLFGEQNELAEAITALGKPVVLYLVNGRPLAINRLAEKVPAIIEGWYMGQETGTAAAVKPGETKKVTFEITPAKLAFHNIDMKFLVEQGAFEIMTGPSSNDTDLQKTVLTVK